MNILMDEVNKNTQVKSNQEKYDVKLGIHEWKRYPEYKDSGVEWIGEIPKEWSVSNLRYKLKDGSEGIKIGPFGSQLKIDDMQESGFKVYGQENVIYRDFYLGSKYINEDKYKELSSCKLYPGDIVISMMGTTGRCQVVPNGIKRGVMDSHLLRLRTKEDEVLSYFISLLVDETYYVREQINAVSKGAIMNGLNSSLIKSLLLAIPSLLEQKKIIEFLDRETSKIDALIEKKQRFIELLEEKRSALISHAVTRGLDPDVRMRDSEIEWIGEIPEEWNVVKLKYLSDIRTGEKDTVDKDDNGEYPFFVRSQTVEKINTYSFDGEAVLTAGDGVGVGKVFHYYNGKFEYHQRVYKISDFKEILGKYLFYFMKDNLHKEVMKISAKSTVDSLRLPMFLEFPIAFGKIQEQKRIINYLDRETEKIDTLINKISAQIEKLKEYRTALISAAVTGKIDVREEVA